MVFFLQQVPFTGTDLIFSVNNVQDKDPIFPRIVGHEAAG
jgi:hypothetical protein